MMRKTMVSVIVPVFNVEAFLNECIKSVVNQNYADWEMLLVDDGSTDSSNVICDTWERNDKRIRVFHKTNGGLSSARNYGLEKASGKYIIFLDSDDYWLTSDALGNLVQVAESFQADIVRGEYKEVDEGGNDLLMKDIAHKLDKAYVALSSAEFYRSIVNGENFSVLFLFARHLFDGDLVFNEKRCFEEDVELNIRLFCRNLRCVYVPEVFYAYRKRRNSIVNSFRIEHLHDSFLLSVVFEEYSRRASDPLLKQIYCENAVMMYYWTLVTMAEEPYYQRRKEIIKKLGLRLHRIKILCWAHKYRVFKKSYIFNLLSPNMSIVLFRFRNKYLM